MEALPSEIIVKIASYLPQLYSDDIDNHPAVGQLDQRVRPAIASLATISRRWQLAVEPLLFRKIRVKSVELDEFASVFSTSHSRRRRLLNALLFEVLLPAYSEAECAVYESDRDRQANDRVTSEAIARLFDILSSWGSDPTIDLSLYIDAYSPMDDKHRADYRLTQPQQDRDGPLVAQTDLFAERYSDSYIRLSDPDTLPVVPCVRSVNLRHEGDHRKFYPSSVVALAAKTPRTKDLSWWYREPGVYLKLRREMRNDFVQALQTFRLAPSTDSLGLVISGNIDTRGFFQGHSGHDLRLPNFVSPHRHDPLCSALHRLVGNNLKDLFYMGPVDPSLFWPYLEGEEPREPLWSSLTELYVYFNPGSPSGRWYFRGPERHPSDDPLPVDLVGHMPPGYGSEEETREALTCGLFRPGPLARGEFYSDGFRTVPDDEVMLPLLEAFIRAISHMPALTTAHLSTDTSYRFSVGYQAPWIDAHRYDCDIEGGIDISAPRVFFQTGNWRPSPLVLELCRKIGRKTSQRDAIITFLPSVS